MQVSLKGAHMAKAKWRSYEEVATFLLNECASHLGLERVEGKQDLHGTTGNEYAIDGKGVREGSEAFVIIECRRHTKSRQKQEHLAALAYRIKDTGTDGGIIVTPLPLQKGAARIAAREGITPVILNANATRHEYVLSFLSKLFAGVRDTARLTETVVVVETNGETGRIRTFGDGT